MNYGQNIIDLKATVNGDNTIMFTNSRALKVKSFTDSQTVWADLMDPNDETNRKHLGLIQVMEQTHKIAVPFLKDLWAGAQVLTVNEGESITYDLPIVRDDYRCVTMEDTSADYDFPGLGQTVFSLILNEEFAPGDILTYDMQHGEQCIVSDEHEVEPVGDNFLHWVRVSSGSNQDSFPVSKLRSGVQYWKVGNVIGEFSTRFSGINGRSSTVGTITNEFILGDPRGVEVAYTRKAANMQMTSGMTQLSNDMFDKVMSQVEQMGGNDMFVLGKTVNGQLRNGRVGTLLEYFALMELAQMEASSLMFAKGATIQTSNGVKRINEGAWHQMRRGKRIEYARPGGITKNHLYEAANYLFANSNQPVELRRIKFKAGYMAYQNMMDLFRHEALAQLSNLPAGMLGADAQIPAVFSGPLNNLKMEYIAIKEVPIPGLGIVTVEHDPSLDYQPFSDRLGKGFYGNQSFAHSSYSLVIWDATSSEYANVEKSTKGMRVPEGANKRANMYYVKPEGSSVTWGYQQGRMADGASFNRVVSSMKNQGREFWAFNQSGVLLLDTTRYITIELARLDK